MLNGKWEIPVTLYDLKSMPKVHVNYREPKVLTPTVLFH